MCMSFLAHALGFQPLFENFVSNAGCGTGGLAEKLACLRSVDVDTLVRARNGVYNL